MSWTPIVRPPSSATCPRRCSRLGCDCQRAVNCCALSLLPSESGYAAWRKAKLTRTYRLLLSRSRQAHSRTAGFRARLGQAQSRPRPGGLLTSCVMWLWVSARLAMACPACLSWWRRNRSWLGCPKSRSPWWAVHWQCHGKRASGMPRDWAGIQFDVPAGRTSVAQPH